MQIGLLRPPTYLILGELYSEVLLDDTKAGGRFSMFGAILKVIGQAS